jgi:hypothetical protein
MTQNEESTDIENLEPKDAKEIPRQANLAEAEILECLYIQLSRKKEEVEKEKIEKEKIGKNQK